MTIYGIAKFSNDRICFPSVRTPEGALSLPLVGIIPPEGVRFVVGEIVDVLTVRCFVPKTVAEGGGAFFARVNGFVVGGKLGMLSVAAQDGFIDGALLSLSGDVAQVAPEIGASVSTTTPPDKTPPPSTPPPPSSAPDKPPGAPTPSGESTPPPAEVPPVEPKEEAPQETPKVPLPDPVVAKEPEVPVETAKAPLQEAKPEQAERPAVSAVPVKITAIPAKKENTESKDAPAALVGAAGKEKVVHGSPDAPVPPVPRQRSSAPARGVQSELLPAAASGGSSSRRQGVDEGRAPSGGVGPDEVVGATF